MKTVKQDQVKIYLSRDAATARLRKIGLRVPDYDLFINKLPDGRLACNVSKAEEHFEAFKDRYEDGVELGTISNMCREMILNGYSNTEIFTALQEKFGEDRIGTNQRHYPSWYRCALRREGRLPPAFDCVNQDPNAVHKFED